MCEVFLIETRVLVQAVKRNINRFPTEKGGIRPFEVANCDFKCSALG